MIESTYLNKLTECFKRSHIANPVFYKSYFFDAKGATMGVLDWEEGVFYLHTNYVKYEMAKEVLKDGNVEFKEKVIDLAELVYGQKPKQSQQKTG